jgi:hypothetical protein
VRGATFIDIDTRGAVVVGVNHFAQGQNGIFFHLAGLGIQTSNLLVTVAML